MDFLKSRFVGMELGFGSAASELITIIGKYAEALKTTLSNLLARGVME